MLTAVVCSGRNRRRSWKSQCHPMARERHSYAPSSIVAEVAHVDESGELRHATFSRPLCNPNVVARYTLMRVLRFGFGSLPIQFDGDDAVKVELALDGCRYAGAPQSRFGHNAMAEVRTLLRFSGRCDGALK